MEKLFRDSKIFELCESFLIATSAEAMLTGQTRAPPKFSVSSFPVISLAFTLRKAMHGDVLRSVMHSFFILSVGAAAK